MLMSMKACTIPELSCRSRGHVSSSTVLAIYQQGIEQQEGVMPMTTKDNDTNPMSDEQLDLLSGGPHYSDFSGSHYNFRGCIPTDPCHLTRMPTSRAKYLGGLPPRGTWN
jgi:hypothetical protein